MTTKQDEKLDLRAAPGHKLVRFRKGVVIGGAAVASAGLLGVTMLALQAPSLRTGQPAEQLYNTDKKPTPDGLAALPGDYSQIQPKTPELGPPLPGDLGRPILERQRQLGIAPGGTELSAAEQRLASQAIQAKESAVFFRIENRPQQNAAQAGQSLTEKNLNIQPTITIRPGWPLRIVVQRDIVLRPFKGN